MSDDQVFQISGMTCNGCVNRVKDALTMMPDVLSADISLDPPQARIDATRPVEGSELTAAVSMAGDYTLSPVSEPLQPSQPSKWETYQPLLLLVLFLALASLIAQLRVGQLTAHGFMSDFMGGFFLAFAYFKLLDLSGFAATFRTYDWVAQRMPLYGWLYPFIEAGLGTAYLLRIAPWFTNSLTVLIMLAGTAGVVHTLRSGREIRCACMGTVFNLPMTTVTVIENLGMASMAAMMMFLNR